MKSILDVRYGQKPEQCLDIHLPESSTFSVLIYFHGGGLETGDKATYTAFNSYLSSHGVAVVSANYRMYPDAKYPDFLRDAAEAVAWTFRNIRNYGDVRGIYIGGSSAGGYLSQMLCFDRSWLARHGISPMDAAGFVLDAGQPTCHYNVLRERGMDARRVVVDDTAPIYHIDADVECPPMLIIVSDEDIENRYEQTKLLVSTLKHFGHADEVQLKVMHGTHCAYIMDVDENGDSVLGRLVLPFVLGRLHSAIGETSTQP